ncbi:hypothetical protein K438DRAFT_1972356 [Mycena galopus ATCC 62051]|nr:hypothetical protein K438DRAFT_1972356 [Mycena galopus ATCC 62051]
MAHLATRDTTSAAGRLRHDSPPTRQDMSRHLRLDSPPTTRLSTHETRDVSPPATCLATRETTPVACRLQLAACDMTSAGGHPAEPFATAFQEHLNTRTTRDGGVSLLDRLSKTLETPHYVTLLYDWLSFTLGRIIVEHLPEDALHETRTLFLNVLFIRYQYGGQKAGEEMAYRLLAEAQMANFRRHFDEDNTPAEFSLVDCVGETWRPNKNAGELDWEDISDQEEGVEMGDVEMGNFEMGEGDEYEEEDEWDDEEDDEEDDEDDEDYVDEGDADDDEYEDLDVVLEAEMESQPAYLPRFIKAKPIVPALPEEEDLLQPDIPTDQLPAFWAGRIQVFFFNTAVGPRNRKPVVHDLVVMRKLKKTQYRTPAFLSAIKTSGLFHLMRKVARPGNLLETSDPDIEQSFRWHDWKLNYAELICRWILPTESDNMQCDTSHPNSESEYSFSTADARGLLIFIAEHPRMQPWGFNPMAVYLFLSLSCFKTNCDLWLVPCLRELKYPKIEGWDAAKVYRRLMDLPCFKKPSQRLERLSENSDRRLKVIIRETAEYRVFVKKVWRELYRPPSGVGTQPDANAGSSSSSDLDDSQSEETFSDIQPSTTSSRILRPTPRRRGPLSKNAIRKRRRRINSKKAKSEQGLQEEETGEVQTPPQPGLPAACPRRASILLAQLSPARQRTNVS